jgi:hypothetical protein
VIGRSAPSPVAGTPVGSEITPICKIGVAAVRFRRAHESHDPLDAGNIGRKIAHFALVSSRRRIGRRDIFRVIRRDIGENCRARGAGRWRPVERHVCCVFRTDDEAGSEEIIILGAVAIIDDEIFPVERMSPRRYWSPASRGKLRNREAMASVSLQDGNSLDPKLESVGHRVENCFNMIPAGCSDYGIGRLFRDGDWHSRQGGKLSVQSFRR